MGSGEEPTAAPRQVRILLVGFMGSGKSSVGRVLARRLGWSFRDFDDQVASDAGLSIPEIFARHGEERFREMEEAAGERLLREEDVVLASGGGWAARPGRLETLPPGTCSVWLKVSPEVAVERARSQEGVRPLLDVPDPIERARTLIREREPFYRKADRALDTDRATPEALADRLLRSLTFDDAGMRRNPEDA